MLFNCYEIVDEVVKIKGIVGPTFSLSAPINFFFLLFFSAVPFFNDNNNQTKDSHASNLCIKLKKKKKAQAERLWVMR